jgi:hypothetical protein
MPGGERGGQLALDLRAPLPPPSHDIDAVPVRREQRSLRCRVMPVPSVRLLGLHLPNGGFIVRRRRRHPAAKRHASKRQQPCIPARASFHFALPVKFIFVVLLTAGTVPVQLYMLPRANTRQAANAANSQSIEC